MCIYVWLKPNACVNRTIRKVQNISLCVCFAIIIIIILLVIIISPVARQACMVAEPDTVHGQKQYYYVTYCRAEVG